MTHKKIKALLERIEQTRERLNSGECLDPYEEDVLLVNDFDDNYYGEGSIVIGNAELTIESVWTDDSSAYDTLMIHLNSDGFEGDVEFRSLWNENQMRVLDMLEKHYTAELNNE